MSYVLQKIGGLAPNWYIESETHICRFLCGAKAFKDLAEIKQFWDHTEIDADPDHEYSIVEITDKELFKVRLLGK